jgi:hypothetical protein
MTASTQEETLNRMFREVGKEYGYDNVDAEFVAFKDFKVKWQRSYKWAEFKVSDYMYDAPDAVLEGLARTLFSKISGSDPKPYSDEMCQWVTSDEFVHSKQPVFIRRSRSISHDSEGQCRDLKDSLDRLAELGLAKKDPDLVLSWTNERLQRKAGYCSVLMKVIVLSSVFDDVAIPEYVTDYVLLHEYLTMTEGKRVFGHGIDPEIMAKERTYPKYKEAESWLSRLCLFL